MSNSTQREKTMKKAPAFLSLAMILFLAACGPQATVPATVVPPTAVPPTSAPPPTTEPPTPTTAAAAASPEAASPTPTGACTDLAAFVTDVTIPDYSHLDPKEAFKKTWRVKNAGTCTWTSSYTAVYSRGDALGAPVSITLA